ncbi:Hypothetical predicted protein [Octopus vulgaris]|uniref:Uncharacterized protein n=1 Tax=Octopus vulgaris TaxID=6645 RepID=A0AA36EWY2_OCTVU|nr:Hypothetical predicted protein [Octopus vulgaris]
MTVCPFLIEEHKSYTSFSPPKSVLDSRETTPSLFKPNYTRSIRKAGSFYSVDDFFLFLIYIAITTGIHYNKVAVQQHTRKHVRYINEECVIISVSESEIRHLASTSFGQRSDTCGTSKCCFIRY